MADKIKISKTLAEAQKGLKAIKSAKGYNFTYANLDDILHSLNEKEIEYSYSQISTEVVVNEDGNPVCIKTYSKTENKEAYIFEVKAILVFEGTQYELIDQLPIVFENSGIQDYGSLKSYAQRYQLGKFFNINDKGIIDPEQAKAAVQNIATSVKAAVAPKATPKATPAKVEAKPTPTKVETKVEPEKVDVAPTLIPTPEKLPTIKQDIEEFQKVANTQTVPIPTQIKPEPIIPTKKGLVDDEPEEINIKYKSVNGRTLSQEIEENQKVANTQTEPIPTPQPTPVPTPVADEDDIFNFD